MFAFTGQTQELEANRWLSQTIAAPGIYLGYRIGHSRLAFDFHRLLAEQAGLKSHYAPIQIAARQILASFCRYTQKRFHPGLVAEM